MRATHIRPRNARASPERPGTACSTRSTIRRVEPSPDSRDDALANSYAASETPAPGLTFEPFPPFEVSGSDNTVLNDEPYAYVSNTDPTASVEGALRRGGTPSGRTSPRKSRSCSPQKSRSQSPRKHLVRTPTLPAHQESPSSAYSASDSEKWEAPDTPSPVSRQQQKDLYAPLKVQKPFAENGRIESGPGHGTHARIAEYMRKLQNTRSGGTAEGAGEHVPTSEPIQRVGAPVPHIVQAMAQPSRASVMLSPFSAAQRQAQNDREPARHTDASRRSEASGASVASRHSIFSTPGRDEMERKKPIVEEDEGPFAKATNMQDLERKRRRVSEATEESGENEERRRFCGIRCVVM
ncbi:hypothetical protein C7974DRAFT_412697 [Boeremia exigua]|uniref:uncharacterized protein n=1 Tax=Boeremia exigua TaxID=749465 RepID=UPI001E8D46C1|nr:uncharacterized protein C7974DRAFT_412697 [Boeremia exigua]KAH6633723.1 hypothetical protein C7974DRAFT_412697 [Boeremia exigua]